MDFTITNEGLKWTRTRDSKLMTCSSGSIQQEGIEDVIKSSSGRKVFVLSTNGVFGTHTISDNGATAVTQTDVQMFQDTCLSLGFGD